MWKPPDREAAFKHLIGSRPVHHPCGRILRVAERRKAQIPDVGLPKEPTAVWTGWLVGRVAQVGRDSG